MADRRWKQKESNRLDFHEGRNGDHTLTPFECDLCIFRKLKKRNPLDDGHQDKLLLVHIRRMNLDALWSRARSTVAEHKRRVNQTVKFCQTLGLSGPFEHQGPYPLRDHCGYEVALAMLAHSRNPGKHEQLHTQFVTIRKLRTSYSSQFKASPAANLSHHALVNNKGHHVRLVDDKCGSLWFNRFMTGMKARMGSTWKPNKALSHALMKAVICKVEGRIEANKDRRDIHKWITFSTYSIISYVISLRGTEGLMLELGTLRKYWPQNRTDHFIIPLFGKLKGEDTYREHLIPCINITKSGINVKYAVERLKKDKEKLMIMSGPAISDESGSV